MSPPSKRGKTHFVASTPQPTAAVYVFAHDHPDAGDPAIYVMFEFTPAGACIRRLGLPFSTRN